LQGLAQRTPLTSLKTLSLKMLADTSMPAAADLPLLAQWNEQLKQCYSAGETYREHTVTPESKAILDAQQHANQALIAQFYAGQMSYGDFNRARQALYDQFAEQASASARKMFDARAAQAQTAQQAALDAQRRIAGDSDDGADAGASGELGGPGQLGRQMLKSSSYPQVASNALGSSTPDPSALDPAAIAAAACVRAGLGATCTGSKTAHLDAP